MVYSPQCPSNVHFIREIEEWSKLYKTTVETINVFEESERAGKYIEKTPIGYTKHLFIAVFIDGKWIPSHPGNPQFGEDLLRSLKETT